MSESMVEKNRPSPVVVVATELDRQDNEGNETSSCNLSKATSRPWTQEEDDMITEHVEKHGTKSWSLLVTKIENRTGKQMRERWHNQLDPKIRKDPWSKDEDDRLVMAYQKYGSRWAEISKLFDCRTDNAIKNRWYGNLRKTTRSLEKQCSSPAGDGGLKKDGTMSPAVGSKRSAGQSPVSEDGLPTSKRQAVGANVGVGAGFSTVAEAMVACFRVFDELQTIHYPKAVASTGFTPQDDDAVNIPSDLKEIKGKLEQNLYRTPHDFHKDIVSVWRRCSEDQKKNKLLYTLACRLSQLFDELYFKHVYMPLNVTSFLPSNSVQAKIGSKVRIYNAQEHKWWFGSVTEHDAKACTSLVTEIIDEGEEGEEAQDPLQVWTQIPSFYAETVSDASLRSLSASCARAAAPDISSELVMAVAAGGVSSEKIAAVKAALEQLMVSKLFPSYRGKESVIDALASYVQAEAADNKGDEVKGKSEGKDGDKMKECAEEGGKVPVVVVACEAVLVPARAKLDK